MAADGDAGDDEGDDEVDDEQPAHAALPHVDATLAHPHRGRADEPEHRARRPRGQGRGAQKQGAERSGQEGGEIEGDELHPPDGPLKHLAEAIEQHHVEPDVDHAVVDEARRHQAVPLAVGHRGAVERQPRLQVAAPAHGSPLEGGDHEHRDIHSYQRLGGEGPRCRVPAPHPLAPRRAGGPDALPALGPDRGLVQALRAGGPAAAGARPSRLPVGVMEAGDPGDGVNIRGGGGGGRRR